MSKQEDTIVAGCTIEMQDCTLTVHDLKKPLWYGDYYHGKLAIYEAQVTGTVIPKSITCLCVFTDDKGKDFVLSSVYEESMSVEAICAHLQTHVILEYHKQQVQDKTYVPGPDTRQ